VVHKTCTSQDVSYTIRVARISATRISTSLGEHPRFQSFIISRHSSFSPSEWRGVQRQIRRAGESLAVINVGVNSTDWIYTIARYKHAHRIAELIKKLLPTSSAVVARLSSKQAMGDLSWNNGGQYGEFYAGHGYSNEHSIAVNGGYSSSSSTSSKNGVASTSLAISTGHPSGLASGSQPVNGYRKSCQHCRCAYNIYNLFLSSY
jgi:hypothetical protein